ncbi:MAG: potassium-transporting ATPase KdpC subunit [Gammaproteobacteria bacterium]|jgi:K+-transporting ATPase ATPase C chain|nr:potassium-transporting ATPase KdpC subunit [Gammaproteobacteria bacterium]
MFMARYIRPTIGLLIVMTVLLGVIYPLVITLAATAVFPKQAAGSLIYSGGTLAGSKLIGQNFSDPKYFWSRPSATSPQPYNGLSSGGSNLGPLNPALIDKVAANAKLLQGADPSNNRPIPVDLVTASASGLDPDISPAAAEYQAMRVARIRKLPLEKVESLVAQHTRGPFLGLIGEPAINVLELNLALDQMH